MSIGLNKAREIRRNILLLNEWKRLTDVMFDTPTTQPSIWSIMQSRALVHELHRTRTGRAVVDKFMARGQR